MLQTCARERGRPCRRRKNFCSKWTTCIEATWGLCCARTNMEYSSSCVGELWLIPTSGHRAYPFAYKPLRPLVEGMTECAEWSAVPDHYAYMERKRPSLVARLRARVAAAIA